MEGEKITHREINLNDLIKHVCARPKMYVGFENFRMIASFIEGFAYACDYDEIRNFSNWLGVKFKKPRNVAWFCNLEEIYPNEEDIFRELPILFEEFINSQKNKSD